MKKFISFLSYHNAVPAALVVLAFGAGSAFAANVAGGVALPFPVAKAPQEIDASALLSVDIGVFDFRPTVTAVVETDEGYTVSYSIETLAPEGSAWRVYAKAGEFSVAKDALDETGLQGYVVAKLRDIKNAERAYLARVQEAEKKLAQARAAEPAGAFASLVGLALDQIPVPVVAKPVPEPVAPEPPAPAQEAPVPEPVSESKESEDQPEIKIVEENVGVGSSDLPTSESASSTAEQVSEEQTETETGSAEEQGGEEGEIAPESASEESSGEEAGAEGQNESEIENPKEETPAEASEPEIQTEQSAEKSAPEPVSEAEPASEE